MLKKENCLLVIIDIQGRLAELVADSGQLFERVGLLLKGIKTLRVPSFYTEQLPEKMGATRPELAPLLHDSEHFVKSSFSCCEAGGFLDALAATGRRQIVLAGIEAHICVCQTGLELLRAGYDVFVVADAVSARDPEQKKVALSRLRAAGADILTVEMLLYELMGSAEDDKFRAILKLVKEAG